MTDRAVWEQQEDEPNRWYQRFCSFRLLGPGRSMLAVYLSEWRKKREEAGESGKTEPKKVPSGWPKAAKEYRWHERAAAWDQHLVDLAASEIEDQWRKKIMGPAEVLGRLSDMARANPHEFIRIDKSGKSITLDDKALAQRGHLVKSISTSTGRSNSVRVDVYDAQAAARAMGDHYKLFDKRRDDDQGSGTVRVITIPADLIAPAFLMPYRDIRDHKHTEYVFSGGRGSTKSTFVSLAGVWLLIRNPTMHMLALRQVKDTLRDSVYSQLTWAIDQLGLGEDFKCTTSPMEITYLPTGQKIYFRGADDPLKIKSIKPPFGYIGILWFEELDQFHGTEAVRSIEQSAIRGGDVAYIFKSFNPPPTAGNWANKYIKIPKENQYRHHSDYTTVPPEWLGKVFIQEAEHLKAINPSAYEHEYLGVANAIGGMVFNNVTVRKITDEEISQFDRIYMGQDWGYYPDPAHWSKCYYNPASLTLYIFDEYRAWRASNRDLYEVLTKQKNVQPNDSIICDSAEPKSVGDFREYGLDAYLAEKDPGSVDYSMKWLQSLKEIIIDQERCPYTTEEFTSYEYEQTKDGEIINEYPDKNNHAIDSVRYALNRIWRQRGK